ncbi:MAG: ABC transporter ATP-binding protein [Microbacteriaceae bacterium]|nr:ABC transporter ATP-binding protein [Microbacteriaceae bacterium]
MSDTQSFSGGIVVSGVRRAFGTVYAVRDVSFTAEPGTVTALIGPNGSGKTTLMLMLASLLRPDAGRIRIAGHDPLTATSAVRQAVGWMPDVLGSWASLSVRSTLETTGRLYRMDRMTAAARAAELIALVGLTELADQPTRVLSRGQKQRLSLARALVHDPEVLLLDEPASGLDPVARIELRRLVRRVAAEGKTVLVSSHVLAELDEMADAAVYIEHGVTASTDRVAGAKRSARAWRIRSSDLLGLEHALLSIGVAQAEITRDRAELLVAVGSETAAAELLRRIVASGLPISVFAPAVGDLEHTFLDLSRSAAAVSVTRAPITTMPTTSMPITSTPTDSISIDGDGR